VEGLGSVSFSDAPIDVCITGAGVIGCALARALLVREPRLCVRVLEKEPEPALHQSGRNSGVVHAGYNQKPGTQKAEFVVRGSRALRQYCREHGVGVVEDGILVVARTPEEEATLGTLLERGIANGATVRLVGREEMRTIEPEVAGIAALHAPEGASLDARNYVLALAEDARSLGATLSCGDAVCALAETGGAVEVRTARESIKARIFVNCGGLHADRLAARMGVGAGYRIVPFRGYYSELVENQRSRVQAHIYPCPDLAFPFLGVHLSRTFDGHVLVGPGAALALGREAYGTFGVNLGDSVDLVRRAGFWRLVGSQRFRALVRSEWRKSVSRGAVAAEASELVPGIRREHLVPYRAGIRAQLVGRDGRLVDDLVVEETPRSVHVLNAVSPALTCSLPFAERLAEQTLGKL
jgi:(S)-2-hydroxyglutarate dehydrogenase